MRLERLERNRMKVKKLEALKFLICLFDGLIKGGGGLISGWAYIRNNIFVGKWMGLYPSGLKPRGALKWDFTIWFFQEFFQRLRLAHALWHAL